MSTEIDTLGPANMTVVDHGIVDGIRWATCKAPLYDAVNGYVQIPDDHPWRGISHSSWDNESVLDDLDMPGGLTYGPNKDGWIGFDTMHVGDYWPGAPDHWKRSAVRFWTPELVAESTRLVAEQLAVARASGPPTIDAEVIEVDDPAAPCAHEVVEALLADWKAIGGFNLTPGVAARSVLNALLGQGYDTVRVVATPPDDGENRWSIPSCGEFHGIRSTGDSVAEVEVTTYGIDVQSLALTPQEARLLAAALLSAANVAEEDK